MCGSRKQMYGSYLKQNHEPVIVEAVTPKTEYAPKKIPKIKWEPNQLYPELLSVLDLNPFL